MYVIEINHLTKAYGNFTAVNDISFSIRKGEFIGFLGVNGAGKSTTINIMSTLLAPTGGEVKICGYDLNQVEEIRKRIGIVYQQNILDDLLTVKENLICRGTLYGVAKEQIKRKLSDLSSSFGLDKILNTKYKLLSGGQKRRCEIAAALIHTPEILFLDEPTTGLDPAARSEVWRTITQMRENAGLTVFLTTHYMEEAAEADRILIMNNGRLLASGTPNELKERYAYDYLKIYSDTPIESRLCKRDYTVNGNCITVKLGHTTEAIDLITDLKEEIKSFEVVQGTLDDVFLNMIGGKNL